ncbi:MAG: MFS transporter [Rhodospirillales bacterium]|nr:MFS transporter [Rhodospirillales bacterium]
MTAVPSALRRDTTIIGLVSSAHFLSHLYQLALPPLFPLLRDEFDVSYTELGAVMTAFYLASGICQVFAGAVVDRLGPHRILLAGLALLAGTITLAAFVPSYIFFLPLAVIAGIGNSVFHPADLAILGAKVGKPRLGRAYSMHAFSGTMGYAAAPLLIGGLAVIWDWRVALAAVGMTGLAAALVLAIFRRTLDVEPHAAPTPGPAGPPVAIGFRNVLAMPAVILAFGYFALTAMAGAGVQTFSVTAVIEIYDVALTLATGVLTGYLVGSASGILLGGLIADRTAHHERVAGAGMGVAALFMLLIASAQLPFPLVIVAIALAGLFAGMAAPSRDMLVRAAATPGAAGRTFGVVYSGFDVGSSIAPLVFGWLVDHGQPQAVFAIIAVVMGFAIVTIVQVRRTTRQPATAPSTLA